MKIGKTTINLEDIATITDIRKPENCEEWEIKYKHGGKIYFSTREEEYSDAIGNISSKELEVKMLEIIELINKPVTTTNEQPKECICEEPIEKCSFPNCSQSRCCV